ncbi:ornithine cyclodeaminase family protein [Mesobacillus harenae]|uniref:ornithine cyclodeaminase family protein n=1 Tax=Mesobacillus harenae TaxID=2213203 RepID=UPI001580D595|nr:NAD(P)-binding domain-containing protein [Mesobacillus harenae]
MLILNEQEIKKILSMSEAIEVNELAYRAFSTGKAESPLRFNMQLDNSEDYTLFMPGYVSETGGLGVKVVTILPDNVKRNLPATQAAILLLDRETGVPSALMGATYITALRTGAGTGVATKYLAREDASVAAIIGTGGMAPGQLEAICAVRDIKEVYVYNRTKDKAEKFVEDMKKGFRNDLTYYVTSSPEEAVRKADVVATSTSSPEPVVKYEWLKKGAHVNAVGAFNSSMQEVDEELVVRADIRAVDGISAASVPGDLSIPLKNKSINKEDLIEIGNLIDQGVKGRPTVDGITFFKSVGISAQDIAVAIAVLEKAKKEGEGMEISL